MTRLAIIAIALAGVAAGATSAAADAPVGEASAPRTIGRVVTAPTAWLPTGVQLSGGIDQHGDTQLAGGVGLGQLAAFELDETSDVRACHACTDNKAEPIHLRRATFKVGVRPGRYFRYQPGLAVGFRKSAAGARGTRTAEVFGVASEDLGPVRLHAGVMVTDAEDDLAGHMGRRPSAFGGVEWQPPQYPRTSLVADLAWLPKLDDTPVLEYATGVAARYQAFPWGSIELGVRHRQNEGLGDLEAFARFNLLAR